MARNPLPTLLLLVPSLFQASPGQPTQSDIKVQSVRWDNQKLESVDVRKAGADGISFPGVYKLPMMYLITVPEGFDGIVILESGRNSDFRIQAWPECPTFEVLNRGTFKYVSMGNTISFKNIERRSSTLYLSIRAWSSLPADGLAFTLTIRNIDPKKTSKL